MDICPVNRQWLHTYILEPFSQGCELFNQAWKGHDCSLTKNPLSLKKRLILALQGVVLLLSPIRNIVWLFWQTFGRPEVLVDPFYPEDALPMPRVKIELPRFDLRIRKRDSSVEKEGKTYINRTVITPFGNFLGSTTPDSNWEMIKTGKKIDATSRYGGDKNSLTGTYEEGVLQRSTEICYNKTVFLERSERNLNYVTVRLGDEETGKEVPLIGNLPWVQQRAVGLKSFILSEKTTTSFCYILGTPPPSEAIPSGLGWLSQIASSKIKYPRAIEIVAKKVGKEKIQDRECVKVEFEIPELKWLLDHVPASHSHWWFDAKEAVLVKSEDKIAKGLFSCSWISELAQNNRSP